MNGAGRKQARQHRHEIGGRFRQLRLLDGFAEGPSRGADAQECAVGAACGQPVPFVKALNGPDTQLDVPAASVTNGIVYVRVPGPASIDQPVPLMIGRSA